jgi:hypothetical protein
LRWSAAANSDTGKVVVAMRHAVGSGRHDSGDGTMAVGKATEARDWWWWGYY